LERAISQEVAFFIGERSMHYIDPGIPAHMRSTLFIFLLTTAVHSVAAQNTVGLLSYDATNTQDGYTLLYPADQPTIFLINNCGEVVHSWTDTTYTPGNATYLMENGDIVACGKSAGTVNAVIDRGGAGEMVDRRNWDGETIWRYTYNTPGHRMHHDVAMLPNGNVLILAWELKTAEQAADNGRDTTGAGGLAVWPEHIIEVQASGINEGSIVWEWHVWDHLVQDFREDLPNYGVVRDHPERIDINYGSAHGSDWLHANSVDFNADLDQILISVPNFNEIWVIDHSTTTEEAAGSTGGNSGHGGDLLYRWGNPAAYNNGTTEDQQLHFQHDARWLSDGLAPNDPDLGRIMVFNNRIGTTYSSVDMIVPPVDDEGNYTMEQGLPFGPDDAVWRYIAPTPEDLFSPGLGSAHKLRNGNFLIGTGRQGQALEVRPDGTTIWEYKIPMDQAVPVAQGVILDEGQACFRATKYGSDHPFLSTVELPPLGYIELEPDTTYCASLTVAVNDPERVRHGSVFPNPTDGIVTINAIPGEWIVVLDLAGKSLLKVRANGVSDRLDLSACTPGTYLLRVGAGQYHRLAVQK
jgi:hypothetical protein